MPTFLHLGCGPLRKAESTPLFNTDAWTEIRVDSDPSVEPDFIGNPIDLSAVSNGVADSLLCRWDIGRVPPEALPLVFGEFRRVLKPVGIAVMTGTDPFPSAEVSTDSRVLRTHPLVKLLERAGFVSIAMHRPDPSTLHVLASKGRRSDPAVKGMLRSHFPG